MLFVVLCYMPCHRVNPEVSPQVGIGKNNTLYALEDGTVRFTKEVFIPLPHSAEAKDMISKLPQGAVLYKSFISVVPKKQEMTFKLVGML